MEIGRRSGIINFEGTTCFRFVSEFARIDVSTSRIKVINPSNFKGSAFDKAHFHLSGTLVDCIDVLEFDNKNESEDEQMARGLYKAYIVDLRTDEVWETPRPFVARDEMGARMKVLIQAREFITSEDEIDMYYIGVFKIAEIPDRIAPSNQPAKLTGGNE